jgi:hypothetical protein
MSCAGLAESWPTTNSRAAHVESSASGNVNFPFHGQTLWKMCRYHRVEVEIRTGRRSLRAEGSWHHTATTTPAGPKRRPRRRTVLTADERLRGGRARHPAECAVFRPSGKPGARFQAARFYHLRSALTPLAVRTLRAGADVTSVRRVVTRFRHPASAQQFLTRPRLGRTERTAARRRSGRRGRTSDGAIPSKPTLTVESRPLAASTNRRR